jgi:hypothetical protein
MEVLFLELLLVSHCMQRDACLSVHVSAWDTHIKGELQSPDLLDGCFVRPTRSSVGATVALILFVIVMHHEQTRCVGFHRSWSVYTCRAACTCTCTAGTGLCPSARAVAGTAGSSRMDVLRTRSYQQ